MLVVVVILAAVGIEHSRAIRRDISFDAALWREPQHGWGHHGQAPDRTSGSGEIHLYFDADGRYSSCDTSYDAL